MPNTLIIGITSDIGQHLAVRLKRDGHRVLGTYRNNPIATLDVEQVRLNPEDPYEIIPLHEHLLFGKFLIDNVIFCIGHPLPLKKFPRGDNNEWDDWSYSLFINGEWQLYVLSRLFGHMKKGSSACFLSAGGVNSCPLEFSAYTIGKVILTKACELIAAEEPDINIFTYGPGWVPTKTHKLMADALPEGERKEMIEGFMKDPPDVEIVMDEVYRDIMILCAEKRVSGKNFARGNRFFNLEPFDPKEESRFRYLPKGLLRIIE